MSASTTLDADIAAIRGEFATSRQNMSNLVDEIKRGAKFRAQGAADQGERCAKTRGQ